MSPEEDEDRAVQVHLFTMNSAATTTHFEWRRHCEELRAHVSNMVQVPDWGRVCVYGPGNGEFDWPSFAIEAPVTAASAALFAEFLTNAQAGGQWHLNVTIRRITVL